MNVYLHSLGCRLNQSEIETLTREFTAAGHIVVGDPAQADLCVANTCAVTSSAERKSLHLVRRLARANPQTRIAVAGCYATLEPAKCTALPGVAWVVPNDEKEETAKIVGATPVTSSAAQSTIPNPQSPIPNSRTRAFVKVQDGCDNHCTYCIVRSLRGPARSRSMAAIVAQVQALTDAGCQEVVLTGANLGSYGRDRGQANGLRELIETLLARTDLPRLRLSSLESWDLDDAFFGLWENPRLCRQLHLPLQSGCNEILRRMGRRTTTTDFTRLVEAARAAIPGLAVTTDLIVGFPGENEAAFRATYDLAVEMEFAQLHVFPYSSRPGTAAARLPDQVPQTERHARARTMRELGSKQALRFRQRFVGQEMEVLWESRRPDGSWPGLTDNYLRIIARAEHNLYNRLTHTRLLTTQNGYLVGEVLE